MILQKSMLKKKLMCLDVHSSIQKIMKNVVIRNWIVIDRYRSAREKMKIGIWNGIGPRTACSCKLMKHRESLREGFWLARADSMGSIKMQRFKEAIGRSVPRTISNFQLIRHGIYFYFYNHKPTSASENLRNPHFHWGLFNIRCESRVKNSCSKAAWFSECFVRWGREEGGRASDRPVCKMLSGINNYPADAHDAKPSFQPLGQQICPQGFSFYRARNFAASCAVRMLVMQYYYSSCARFIRAG